SLSLKYNEKKIIEAIKNEMDPRYSTMPSSLHSHKIVSGSWKIKLEYKMVRKKMRIVKKRIDILFMLLFPLKKLFNIIF
ncbi:MAG: hypothetical protein KAI72_10590, partial [Candidatus Pacebacteria bacterium]|nr:hypothetical protein [Candidatus Paceibacterota bacterium]